MALLKTLIERLRDIDYMRPCNMTYMHNSAIPVIHTAGCLHTESSAISVFNPAVGFHLDEVPFLLLKLPAYHCFQD